MRLLKSYDGRAVFSTDDGQALLTKVLGESNIVFVSKVDPGAACKRGHSPPAVLQSDCEKCAL